MNLFGNIIKKLRRIKPHKKINQHFYSEDIWGIASKVLKEFIPEGMTIYGEIAGYLPNGSAIQGEFDYGCVNPLELWERDFIIKNQGSEEYEKCYLKGRDGKVSVKFFIYRITYTNPKGKVFEFSMAQVQEWCKEKGLTAVPLLYYGFVENFMRDYFDLEFAGTDFGSNKVTAFPKIEFSADGFLAKVKSKYNEKDCYICKNKVPEEGCVIRIESNDLKAYKCKSTRFLEKETKDLDKGVIDIESEN